MDTGHVNKVWYVYDNVVTDNCGCEIECLNHLFAEDLADRLNIDMIWPKGLLPEYIKKYQIRR